MNQLTYFKAEDWYSVTLADAQKTGFPATISKRQLAQLLQQKYPEHKWDMIYLLKGRQAQQKRLERAVRRLFPVTLLFFPFFVVLPLSQNTRVFNYM